jgi:hypothetical protein
MPLFRDKRDNSPPATEASVASTAPAPRGPELLRDGPVLARWFVLYRLEEEIYRTHRYGAPLTVLIAEPQLIVGERVRQDGREAAAMAAGRTARALDLVGWLDDQRIVMILPMTDAPSARFAATRMRDEMWLLSHAHGGQKWQVRLLDDLGAIEALLAEQHMPSAEIAQSDAA